VTIPIFMRVLTAQVQSSNPLSPQLTQAGRWFGDLNSRSDHGSNGFSGSGAQGWSCMLNRPIISLVWTSEPFRFLNYDSEHSFKNRIGEVTGSMVHWSNRLLSWFNSDKKPLNLINN
jgi:hypothetical protein